MSVLKKVLCVLFLSGSCLGFLVLANPEGDQKSENDSTQQKVVSQDHAKSDEAVPDRMGWIGVRIVPLPEILVPHFQTHGKNTGLVLVETVVPESPAAKADLKRGDIILQFSGKEVNSPDDLIELVSKSKAETQSMVVIRDGAKKELSITPEEKSVNELAKVMRHASPFMQGFPQENPGEMIQTPHGMKLGPEVMIGPNDARKMLREMQGMTQKMLREMPGTQEPPAEDAPEKSEKDSSLILPKANPPVSFNANAISSGNSKQLLVSSKTENGKTTIHVTQVLQNGDKTEKKEWNVDKWEDLPPEIQKELGLMSTIP